MTDHSASAALGRAIETATGKRPARIAKLAGGCVGEVRRVTFDDGSVMVAKLGGAHGGLALEGWMLGYLARGTGLPVPEVFYAGDDLLLMAWVEASGAIDARAQADAARLIAALHGRTAPAFGFERDTLIGGLVQPNRQCARWIEFFRDQRLMYMARQGLDHGALPTALMHRVEALCGRLDEWIAEPQAPALIHGDLWGGNVLAGDGRIAAFIDPAIYFADAEIELAFATLFGTFGAPFFDVYGEIRPLADGFWQGRRDLYNLYPLLVHVRLFGGSYRESVSNILEKLGF